MFEDISRFFKSLFSSKAKKKSRFPVLIVIICFLILIPTVFAIFYAYFYDESSQLAANEVQIELYAQPSNKLIATDNVMEANITDSPLISVFNNINITRKPTSKPSDIKAPNFKVIIKHSDKTEEYYCYFNDSEITSFLEDKSGAFFSVDAAAYASFLNSSFSEAAYSEASPPALVTGNGETVIPSSLQWHYKKKNGRTASASLCETASETVTYKIGGGVNLSFEKTPDVCTVIITDANEKEIYSGALEDLPFLTVESGTLLNAKISAAWKNGENSLSFGEVTYEFKISLGDRAEFYLSEKELYPSEFAILTAKNVDDISKMIFSVTSSHNASAFGESSPQSTALNFLRSFSPSFTALDGEVKTAIPIPSGTPAGDYEISIAFGAEKQLFTLTVKDAASPEKAVIGKPFADLSANVSTSAVSGFHTVLKNVPAPNQSLILFRSAFLSPLESGFSSGYKYENTVSATDKEDVFVSIGNEYLSSTVGGSSVPALNSGIVAAVGYSAHLGNYVAVDHGLGIRTWYCCLSSIDVELGDALAKGESVGKCGTKGLVSASGTVILCSVYDCLIDPDFIIGKEIKH